MVDEEGNLCFMACLAISALVGAVVGFGTSLASEAISNGGFDKVNWDIVVSSTIFGAIDYYTKKGVEKANEGFVPLYYFKYKCK